MKSINNGYAKGSNFEILLRMIMLVVYSGKKRTCFTCPVCVVRLRTMTVVYTTTWSSETATLTAHLSLASTVATRYHRESSLQATSSGYDSNRMGLCKRLGSLPSS